MTLEETVISIVGGGLVTVILDHRFALWKRLRKSMIKLRNMPAPFTISTYLEGSGTDSKKIAEDVIKVLKELGYSLEITSKGYKYVLLAQKENLDSFNIEVINDDPAQIILAPIQVGIRDVLGRFEDWEYILEILQNKYGAKLKSISFQIVLPFDIGIQINPPKKLKVDDYEVRLIDENTTKVTATINNTVVLDGTHITALKRCFKNLI
jgi:hypothetical protein